ncbi:hypothetical protein E4U23_001630 [Claviceps purpurea]|nr:hypothetical protein E4U23_001630 [Claviceps purpurea]
MAICQSVIFESKMPMGCTSCWAAARSMIMNRLRWSRLMAKGLALLTRKFLGQDRKGHQRRDDFAELADRIVGAALITSIGDL